MGTPLTVNEVEAKLKRAVQRGAIAIDPTPGRHWKLGYYTIFDPTRPANTEWRYRILKPIRGGPEVYVAPSPPPVPVPEDKPVAPPTPTTRLKGTQSARAARHIERLYPNGTDKGISSEVICKKLEKDPDLLAELKEKGGKPPSRATVDRVRGLR